MRYVGECNLRRGHESIGLTPALVWASNIAGYAVGKLLRTSKLVVRSIAAECRLCFNITKTVESISGVCSLRFLMRVP